MIGKTNAVLLKKSTDYEVGSQGLKYTLSQDGSHYICSGYGSATDLHVVIGSVHNGLPVTEVGTDAFLSKSRIKSIYFPDSITIVGSGACKACTSLQSVSFGSAIVSFGGSIFYNCPQLYGIVMRGTNENYLCLGNVIVKKSSGDIICGCNGSVVPRDPIAKYFAGGCFQYCAGLKSIDFPENISRVDGYAFNSCTSLQKVELNDRIYSLGASAFNNCTALTEVVIGRGVSSISSKAFANCSSLTKITLRRYITTSSSVITALANLDSIPYQNEGLIIRVPSESLELYKSANNWSVMADKIVGYDVE